MPQNDGLKEEDTGCPCKNCAGLLQRNCEDYQKHVLHVQNQCDDATAQLQKLTEEFRNYQSKCAEERAAWENHVSDCERQKEAIRMQCNGNMCVSENENNSLKKQIAAVKLQNDAVQTKYSTALQMIESIRNELNALKKQRETNESELNKKLAEAVTENQYLRIQSANDLTKNMSGIESSLRASEQRREQLEKTLADQSVQSNTARDSMQREYEKQILEIGARIEEDYRKKRALFEEQSQIEVKEWKTEYTKMRDIHQQYTKMVDERLEQHSKTLKDRHKMETSSLLDQLKQQDIAQNKLHKEILKLQQQISAKEIEYRNACDTVSSIQKKLKVVEEKVKASSDLAAANELLTDEINRLKNIKDPATITQATLMVERGILREQLEQEYTEKSSRYEEETKTTIKIQLVEQEVRHETEIRMLKDEITGLNGCLNRERLELAKKRSDFVEKKRNLEEQLTSLTTQQITDAKNFEQKLAAEVKAVKIQHEKTVRNLKAEKVEMLKCMETAHKTDLQTAEENYKTERNFLLRQHREEQRELLSKLSSSIESNCGKEYQEEMKKLHAQNVHLSTEHSRICIDMERSFSRVVAQLKEEYVRNVKELESRLQECTQQLSATQNEKSQLRKSLNDVQEDHQKFRAELSKAISNREAEYEEKLALQLESCKAENEKRLLKDRSIAKEYIEKIKHKNRELAHEVARYEEEHEEIKEQLKEVLCRNNELEANHASMHKRLRQSGDMFSREAFADSGHRIRS